MLSDILITLILVLLNGFFVAAEFAIVKVRESQLQVEAQSGNRSALLARKILRNIDGYLAATQLGITLASLGLGWVGEPVVSKILIQAAALAGLQLEPELAHSLALPLAFALITLLHIVFGELAPKSIAIQRSEQTALMVAYPLRFFYLLFRPFIFLLNGIANFILRLLGIEIMHGSEIHSSEELKYLVQQGKESGTLGEDKFELIRNAFDFADRSARQIMIPRAQVLALNLDTYTERDLEAVLEAGYSRIPCYRGSFDRVTGVVFLKDLLMKLRRNEQPDPETMLRPILNVPETKPIGSLLKEFQVKRTQMAVVIDEFGTAKGIVTMEDILEELVGEIQDEFDNETPVVRETGPGRFSVMASSSLNDVNKALPVPIAGEGNFETISGYLLHKMGRIPEEGEELDLPPYRFHILEKAESSLGLLELELTANPETETTGKP